MNKPACGTTGTDPASHRLGLLSRHLLRALCVMAELVHELVPKALLSAIKENDRGEEFTLVRTTERTYRTDSMHLSLGHVRLALPVSYAAARRGQSVETAVRMMGLVVRTPPDSRTPRGALARKHAQRQHSMDASHSPADGGDGAGAPPGLIPSTSDRTFNGREVQLKSHLERSRLRSLAEAIATEREALLFDPESIRGALREGEQALGLLAELTAFDRIVAVGFRTALAGTSAERLVALPGCQIVRLKRFTIHTWRDKYVGLLHKDLDWLAEQAGGKSSDELAAWAASEAGLQEIVGARRLSEPHTFRLKDREVTLEPFRALGAILMDVATAGLRDRRKSLARVAVVGEVFGAVSRELDSRRGTAWEAAEVPIREIYENVLQDRVNETGELMQEWAHTQKGVPERRKQLEHLREVHWDLFRKEWKRQKASDRLPSKQAFELVVEKYSELNGGNGGQSQ